MTPLDELEKLAKAATPVKVFRVFCAPDSYSGDEWDLLRGFSVDFENAEDAADFAKKKRQKRLPDYAQPYVKEIEIPGRIPSPDVVLSLIAEVRRLRELCYVDKEKYEKWKRGE